MLLLPRPYRQMLMPPLSSKTKKQKNLACFFTNCTNLARAPNIAGAPSVLYAGHDI